MNGDVVMDEAATWDCPLNENVQGECAWIEMSEPYWLRRKDNKGKRRKTPYKTNGEDKKRKKEEREEKRKEQMTCNKTTEWHRTAKLLFSTSDVSPHCQVLPEH